MTLFEGSWQWMKWGSQVFQPPSESCNHNRRLPLCRSCKLGTHLRSFPYFAGAFPLTSWMCLGPCITTNNICTQDHILNRWLCKSCPLRCSANKIALSIPSFLFCQARIKSRMLQLESTVNRVKCLLMLLNSITGLSQHFHHSVPSALSILLHVYLLS